MMGITNPAEPFFKDGLWLWDGSQWRKQPLLFGYESAYGEDLSDTNLDAGTNYIAGTAVPSGQILVVRHVAALYAGTVPTELYVYVSGGLSTVPVLAEYTIASLHWYLAGCFLVLEAGDQLALKITGATAGDQAFLRYSGYKMGVAE